MKWLIGLVTTGFVVLVTFVVLAVSFSQPSDGMSSYSHSQLDADRVMTQQMAVQTTMPESGMLQRSMDTGYLNALEQHVQQFNRMIGATP